MSTKPKPWRAGAAAMLKLDTGASSVFDTRKRDLARTLDTTLGRSDVNFVISALLGDDLQAVCSPAR